MTSSVVRSRLRSSTKCNIGPPQLFPKKSVKKWSCRGPSASLGCRLELILAPINFYIIRATFGFKDYFSRRNYKLLWLGPGSDESQAIFIIFSNSQLINSKSKYCCAQVLRRQWTCPTFVSFIEWLTLSTSTPVGSHPSSQRGVHSLWTFDKHRRASHGDDVVSALGFELLATCSASNHATPWRNQR